MRSPIQRLFRQLPLAITFFLLALSVVFFNAFPYDFVIYHLPFALITAKSNLVSISDLPLELINRFNGFPPLWRFIQAFLISAGNPRLLILPNIVGFLILAHYAKRILEVNYLITTLSIFSFPIALFGFSSSYQDFFVAACVSVGSILLADSLTVRKVLYSNYKSLPFFVLAATSKYQGLLQSIAILAASFFFVAIIPLFKKQFIKVRLGQIKSSLLPLILCAFVVSVHPVSNFVAHSNPFFPIQSSLFRGSEKNFVASPAYTQKLGFLKSPVNYIVSYTELDWIFRGVVPHYDLDQSRSKEQFGGILDANSYTGDGAQFHRGIIRTGGTYAPYAVFVGFMFTYSTYKSLSKLRIASNSTLDSFTDSYYSTHILLSCFALTSLFLPQSHNLRYQMYSLMLLSLSTFSIALRDKRIAVYVRYALCFFASISLLLVYIQPAFITLRNSLSEKSMAPVLDYPIRDLSQCSHDLQTNVINSKHNVLVDGDKNYIEHAYCTAAKVFIKLGS